MRFWGIWTFFFFLFKNKFGARHGGASPEFLRQNQVDLRKFKASLLYIVSFRPVGYIAKPYLNIIQNKGWGYGSADKSICPAYSKPLGITARAVSTGYDGVLM